MTTPQDELMQLRTEFTTLASDVKSLTQLVKDLAQQVVGYATKNEVTDVAALCTSDRETLKYLDQQLNDVRTLTHRVRDDVNKLIVVDVDEPVVEGVEPDANDS